MTSSIINCGLVCIIGTSLVSSAGEITEPKKSDVTTPSISDLKKEEIRAYEQLDYYRSKKDKEKVSEKMFNTPISFWGKVVDQDGAPVVGAIIEMHLLDKCAWDELDEPTTSYQVRSDHDGRFDAVDKRGASITVNAKAEGYTPAYNSDNHTKLSRATLSYSELYKHDASNIPTKEDPYVLVLRKKGKIANLKEIKLQKVAIQRDGTSIDVAVKGTPITINARYWSAAPEPFTFDKYSWRAELRGIGVKLLPIANEHAVMAPDVGYQDLIQIKMPADIGESWGRVSPRGLYDYWLKMDDGNYARLRIEVLTGRKHELKIRGWLNFDGTNSFEQ